MARFETAGTIINRTAAELGLTPVADPFTSTDSAFLQLCSLLTSAGQEMLVLHEWQKFNKTHSLTTGTPPDDDADGHYDLPDDFGYMIDQTGWEPTNRLPLGGPLTPQDWTYLVNTNLGSTTIYVSFRQNAGQFWILPNDPPPTGIEITFEYVSRNWVEDGAVPGTFKDSVESSADIVMYEPILIIKFLKLRQKEAKGFDTTAAVGQFITMFNSWTGKDASAPILNAARSRYFPYLGWRNVPDTGFGAP